MKNSVTNKFMQQLGLVVILVGVVIGFGSVYQADAAPPEPKKLPNSTPLPPGTEGITVEGVTQVLSQTMVMPLDIEPMAVTKSQNFEGSWPASGWQLIDQSGSDGGQYLWGKRTCHPHTGTYGGWSVGGGTKGSTLSCSANYPNNADTWAVYGPFDLSNATAASLTFYMWGRTEVQSGCPFDFFFAGSSINGSSFSGSTFCGNYTTGTDGNGYHQRTLDLTSRLGQNQVWLAFRFKSDSSISYSGITIDDITLDVTTSGSGIPAFPTTLTASGVTQTTILLNWKDNSDNETGFKIEQSLDGVSGWTQVTTTPANVSGWPVSNLACGTTYYYRVRAYNASGNSAYSNSDSTQTIACDPPTIPPAAPSLTVTPVSESQIDLLWIDNSTDEDGFKIERAPDGTTWTQIADVGANTTTHSDTNLKCDTTYHYRMLAYNANGNSAYSNTPNTTTFACSYDIYLPFVLKSLPLPPTPTATPTTPPPPTATPGPANELDGTWVGTTSQGKQVRFTIANRSFTTFTTGYQIGGCGSEITSTFGTPKPIIGITFTIDQGSSGKTVTTDGTFNSNSSASGTLTVKGTLCGDATPTWTATKQ